ncbi:uncharacterized protein LOC117086124 [Trachypithecus francoisi]|uniref:uncharacterized protein LOC117086124 n=1 Tax=Trachypithecus francoisi TaxID=54180 RepID=UPI00141AB272|nr:uncharacterized protein LOC117086124 [Trachypithecus francoisi]
MPVPRHLTQRAPGQRFQGKSRRLQAGVPGIPPWCRLERGEPWRGGCSRRRRPRAGPVPGRGDPPGRASRRSGQVGSGEGGGRGSRSKVELRLRVLRQQLLEDTVETQGGSLRVCKHPGPRLRFGSATLLLPRLARPHSARLVTARATCPRTLLRDGQKTWGPR